ncbi:MAG: phosphatidylserine decarboxylase family protein [Imperialibacter sp.]|uniref:phosphatidylserine decarboxylase family protein n=1 Tax=Imperialibacter sp. TaxID=2038411 RepID=UPI0032ED2EA2
MTIHKEGRTFLLVMAIIFIGLNYVVFNYVSMSLIQSLVLAASIVIYLLFLQFFRLPKCVTPEDPKAVYAPAEGKVVVIEKTTEDEYLKDERIQISIFMSPLNVHVNRAPIKGKVSFFKYHPGKYLVAWHPKSSTENERTTVVMENDKGVKVLFRQIAGAVARRIKWYVKEGDELAQGEEFGFIKFGSRVDVFLPLDAKIEVNINDKTTGGKTVIARLA